MALLLAGATLLTSPGCKNRQETTKEELKESGYAITPESFFRAAESDDTAALEKLIKGGIAVDTRNEAGITALHAAAAAGMLKSAGFLLDKGLPVDVTGPEDRTPLMSAVATGSPEMVRFLLSRRASPLKKDAKGYKPLMLAVEDGRPEMVAELAAHDRESLDTALLLAALQGKAAIIDELTSYGASVYARTDDGRSPLMLAAQNGNIEAVEMLVGIGANRFSMDEEGRIAADIAREAGHEELALRLAEQPEKDEFGIEEPADLGAEMLAEVDARSASGDGGGKNSPGHAAGDHASLPELDGAELAVFPEAPSGPIVAAKQPSPASPLKMRAYRQKELPLRIETVRGDVATVRFSGGEVKEVKQGETISGSGLVIVRVERRMREEKDRDTLSEASVVEVEDSASGHRRELVTGLASTAHDPVALVEDADGRRYLARNGQNFRGADGSDYHVIDVRPNQMVIENRTKGEVITVPLRGPRG